jgi:hypothetical protein
MVCDSLIVLKSLKQRSEGLPDNVAPLLERSLIQLILLVVNQMIEREDRCKLHKVLI